MLLLGSNAVLFTLIRLFLTQICGLELMSNKKMLIFNGFITFLILFLMLNANESRIRPKLITFLFIAGQLSEIY